MRADIPAFFSKRADIGREEDMAFGLADGDVVLNSLVGFAVDDRADAGRRIFRRAYLNQLRRFH
jgi:hypothetical protein